MKMTLRKHFSVLMAIILAFCCFPLTCFAADDSVLKFKVVDGSAVVTACDKAAEGAVVVPSVAVIKGKSYDVRSIGESAFEGCDKITSISIAEGVMSIGARAFADCKALTDVYVPSTLNSCMYTAFNGCGTVTVHCYSSNYQFFTVYGINSNISIDILDGEDSSSSGGSDGMANMIVNLIKKIILMLLNLIMNRGK